MDFKKILLFLLALGGVVLMAVPTAVQNVHWYEMGFKIKADGFPAQSRNTIKRGLWTHKTFIAGTPGSEGEDVHGKLLGNDKNSFCQDDAKNTTGGKCCDHFEATQVSA